MSSMYLLVPRWFDIEWSSKYQDNNNAAVAREQPTTTRIENSAPRPPSLAPTPPFPLVHMPQWPSTMYSKYPFGWLSIPRDCCFPTAPFYCPEYQQYLNRKNVGRQVRGRPPHQLNCVREVRWEYVPGWLDLKGCSVWSDEQKKNIVSDCMSFY